MIYFCNMKNKILISLISILLFSSITIYAESFVRYRVSGMGGMILKGSVVDKYNTGHPLGVDIGFEFQPTGKWQSLQQWNNASVGLGLSYLNLGNNEMFGNAIAPYGYLNIPFVSLKHFVFGIRPGFGLAFVDKTYYNTVDPAIMYNPKQGPLKQANGAIGSHTNAYFAEALYMEFPIKNGWSIVASYGWYHISNGSIRQPNSGYNMFNGQLGVSYMPHSDSYETPAPERNRGMYGLDNMKDKNPNLRPWSFTLAATGGMRQAYYADNKNGERFFGIATLAAAFHYRFVDIFQLGIGIDGFYDGWYRQMIANGDDATKTTSFVKTYIPSKQTRNSFRVGLSLQPEFVVGNFSAAFHFGIYLFDPIKNLEPYNAVVANGGTPLNRGLIYPYNLADAGVSQDGWLYTRIVTRYMVTPHLFVQLDMKSHLMKAEFISAGLGVKL